MIAVNGKASLQFKGEEISQYRKKRPHLCCSLSWDERSEHHHLVAGPMKKEVYLFIGFGLRSGNGFICGAAQFGKEEDDQAIDRKEGGHSSTFRC
ncbi:hypothetical protein HPP92_006323 [Vanilla planifolia]|uniref:Uncharacterized protein n=1 Tax=Vanilla planifolia TaxID=51239 RepID=A0A835VA66_VANPL|nr:hypothetical protein HPP92_006323 [Vanilla planifolia]